MMPDSIQNFSRRHPTEDISRGRWELFQNQTCLEDEALVNQAKQLRLDQDQSALLSELYQVMLKPNVNGCDDLIRVGMELLHVYLWADGISKA